MSGIPYDLGDSAASKVFVNARNLAVNTRSKYLLSDHLLWALIQTTEFQHLFPSTSVIKLKAAKDEIEHYLVSSKEVDRNSAHVVYELKPTSTVKSILDSAIHVAISKGTANVTIYGIIYGTLLEKHTMAYSILSSYLGNDGDFSNILGTILRLDHTDPSLKPNMSQIFDIYGQDSSSNSIAYWPDNSFTSSIIKEIEERLKHTGNPQSTGLASQQPDPVDQKKSKEIREALEILDKYCINLNLLNSKKAHTIVGRESEINGVLQVLGRKVKRNAVLTGGAGVGKSAVVDGLVHRLNSGAVPESMKNLIVYSLDVGSLLAGSRFRGDFEEKITQIIKALETDDNFVLFIDEIHTVRGTGAGSDSSLDFSNMLKPALARGKLRIIGATTDEEFRKFFEKDKALLRRFQRIDVLEPTPDEAKKIISGAMVKFEDYHGIKFAENAASHIVDLSIKYIQNRALPDKAFDIMDSVASTKKLFSDDTEVTLKDIENEVTKITKVPIISEDLDGLKKYRVLEENIKSKIFGQDHVVETIVRKLLVSASGLRDQSKPILTALFTGTTGVGKTELCKQISQSLDIPFIRFDMSEYQEKHTVSKLIGSPPGYVGYEDGSSGSGALINAIEKTPNCVLLLDEVEKAHPDVLNILLQVMDYGTLTSATDKKVSFKNVVMILTSNIGATELVKNPLGFAAQEEIVQDNSASINSYFKPEFRNRLDAIVTFNQLSPEHMGDVVDKFVNELNTVLESKKLKVILDENSRDEFVRIASAKRLGARPVSGIILEKIKEPLGIKIIMEGLDTDNTPKIVNVKFVDNNFELEINEVTNEVTA